MTEQNESSMQSVLNRLPREQALGVASLVVKHGIKTDDPLWAFVDLVSAAETLVREVTKATKTAVEATDRASAAGNEIANRVCEEMSNASHDAINMMLAEADEFKDGFMAALKEAAASAAQSVRESIETACSMGAQRVAATGEQFAAHAKARGDHFIGEWQSQARTVLANEARKAIRAHSAATWKKVIAGFVAGILVTLFLMRHHGTHQPTTGSLQPPTTAVEHNQPPQYHLPPHHLYRRHH